MIRKSVRTEHPIVFDAEGISRAVQGDPKLRAVLHRSRKTGLPVVVSAITLVEIIYPKINRPALQYVRSLVDIIPVSEFIADEAAKLLGASGLHGHQHAIDSVVAATALALGSNPTIFTSDPLDFKMLVGNSARIMTLR